MDINVQDKVNVHLILILEIILAKRLATSTANGTLQIKDTEFTVTIQISLLSLGQRYRLTQMQVQQIQHSCLSASLGLLDTRLVQQPLLVSKRLQLQVEQGSPAHQPVMLQMCLLRFQGPALGRHFLAIPVLIYWQVYQQTLQQVLFIQRCLFVFLLRLKGCPKTREHTLACQPIELHLTQDLILLSQT